MSFAIITHSPEETQRVGEVLGELVKTGDVLLLQGPLGTGKTCLTQGLAKGIGIATPVTSPTFILVNQYPGPLTLYHIDLYRIDTTAEAEDLGLDDYFFGEGVCAVEWPDRASAVMPPERLLVTLEHTGEHQRRLTFLSVGSRYQVLLLQLREALGQQGKASASSPPATKSASQPVSPRRSKPRP